MRVLLGVVAAVALGQALPVPQVPSSSGFLADTEEVQVAKRQFLKEFDRALSGLLVELAPTPVKAQYLEDTPEVKKAKDAFMAVFTKALNGLIETAYLEDTKEVKKAKEEFFKVFDAATNGLIKTVENYYIEDTAEVKEAKAKFNQAFKDAEEGKVGAQYIPYTPEVQAAREEFFKAFDFALNGMLYKLAPKPVEPFYLEDTKEVKEAKAAFLALFRKAEEGDINSALKVVALEEAIRNNPNNADKAAEEFLETSKLLEEAVEKEDNKLDLPKAKSKPSSAQTSAEESPEDFNTKKDEKSREEEDN